MNPKKFLFLTCSLFLLAGCRGDEPEAPTSPSESVWEQQTETDKVAAPPRHPKAKSGETIIRDVVGYWEGNPNVRGFLAQPAAGRHPAVILIHEWWGLNGNMRNLATKLAQEGYVALAVDLYEGRSTTDRTEAQELASKVRGDMDRAFANLNAAVGYLQNSQYVFNDRIASAGWCFGGGWSYEMAKNDLGVRSSIIYYGQFNPKDDLSQMRATILGHFGEKDRSIQLDTVEEFQATLKTLEGDHEIYIYENADHAFANDRGANYNEEAAEKAWERTLTFLQKHL